MYFIFYCSAFPFHCYIAWFMCHVKTVKFDWKAGAKSKWHNGLKSVWLPIYYIVVKVCDYVSWSSAYSLAFNLHNKLLAISNDGNFDYNSIYPAFTACYEMRNKICLVLYFLRHTPNYTTVNSLSTSGNVPKPKSSTQPICIFNRS